MYIYIYISVCVCVCVASLPWHAIFEPWVEELLVNVVEAGAAPVYLYLYL